MSGGTGGLPSEVNALEAYNVSREVLDNHLSHTFHKSYPYGSDTQECYFYQGLRKVFDVDSITEWHGETIWWLALHKPSMDDPTILLIAWIDYNTRVEIQALPHDLPRRIIEEVRSLMAISGHYEDPHIFGEVVE